MAVSFPLRVLQTVMAQIDDIDQGSRIAGRGVGGAEQKGVGVGEAAHHRGILGGVGCNLPNAIRATGEGGAQMIGAVVIGRERDGAAGGFGGGWIAGQAGEALDGGAEEQQGADERGDGIAGQAEDGQGAELAEHQRFARAHGDGPEILHEPFIGQRVAHQIMGADAGAAGGEQQIGMGGAGGGLGDGVAVIGGDGQDQRNGALGADEGGEGVGVRADDAAGRDRGAGERNFIAGGEDGDDGLAMDGEPGVIGGGCEADGARGEAGACGDQRVTARKILALAADMFALDTLDVWGERGEAHVIAGYRGIFLEHHAIGAIWDQAARVEADGFAGLEAAGERVACGGFADDAERLAEIGGAQRKSVHGREIMRGLVEAGLQGGGEHAAIALAQRDDFAVGGAERRENTGAGVGDGDHGAVKSPDLPPDLWVTRRSSMRMARSAALTMS